MYPKHVQRDKKNGQMQESTLLTTQIQGTNNAAVRNLACYFSFVFWSPLVLVCAQQDLKLHSYVSKGSEEKSKSDSKTEKLKLQNECSLKKIYSKT